MKYIKDQFVLNFCFFILLFSIILNTESQGKYGKWRWMIDWLSGLYSKDSAEQCQKLLQKIEVPPNLFDPYIEEIFSYLRGNIFKRYVESDKAGTRLGIRGSLTKLSTTFWNAEH